MTLPLKGLKIIEISATGPVALFGWILADLGATVLRVDRPTHIEGRKEGTHVENRAVIECDLKRPESVTLIKALMRNSDILVEGYRPGVMERLGLGPEICQNVNPRLIYARCTGWGQDGPMAQEPGHDINYLALTGALASIGTKDRPIIPINMIADYGGGTMSLALGVLAAVIQVQRSGRGSIIDCAMIDGVGVLFSIVYQLHNLGRWQVEREANFLDGAAPYYRCYRCADGKFVAVGALELKFRAALSRIIDVPSLGLPTSSDRANWSAISDEMSHRFLTATRDEWIAQMVGQETCCTPVLDLEEAPNHAHNIARSSFLPGEGGWVPGPAPRFSARPPDRARTPDLIAVLEEFGVQLPA